MDDRLFPIDELVEEPLLPPVRQRRGRAAGATRDSRFLNDYPASWFKCQRCLGRGWLSMAGGSRTCPDCNGMGSLRGRVRLDAGHRCVRCRHPYMPKQDARMLEVERSGMDEDGVWGPWSECDKRCRHSGPMRVWTSEGWSDFDPTPEACGPAVHAVGKAQAAWRILTVHHLDGDKANCRWWNLAALCQRCHLEVQAKVVMERVYPHEHSDWFKPYVAGYYAWVYLGEELTRSEVSNRQYELLGLELLIAS